MKHFFKYSLGIVTDGKEGRHLSDGIVSLKEAKRLLSQLDIPHLRIIRYTYREEDWSLESMEYLDGEIWKPLERR